MHTQMTLAQFYALPAPLETVCVGSLLFDFPQVPVVETNSVWPPPMHAPRIHAHRRRLRPSE